MKVPFKGPNFTKTWAQFLQFRGKNLIEGICTHFFVKFGPLKATSLHSSFLVVALQIYTPLMDFHGRVV